MSGVRRSASSSSSSSQLQQLQIQLQLASTQQAHARLEHGLSRVNATRNPNRSGFSASSAAAAAAAAGMPSVVGSTSGMHVITGSGANGSSSAIPVLGGVNSMANSAHHLGHSHHHTLVGDRGIHGHPHPLQSVSGLSGASDSSSSVSSLGASAFNFGAFGMNGAAAASHSGQNGSSSGAAGTSAFLLRQLSDEESGDEASKAEAELAKAKKSHFVQELVLSTLMQQQMHIKRPTHFRPTEPGGHDSQYPADHCEDDIYENVDKESITSDSDCS